MIDLYFLFLLLFLLLLLLVVVHLLDDDCDHVAAVVAVAVAFAVVNMDDYDPSILKNEHDTVRSSPTQSLSYVPLCHYIPLS